MDASSNQLDAAGRTDPPLDAPERPLPHMRLWFAFYLVWAGTLTWIAAAAFARYEDGAAWAALPWGLALMCFYLSLCNALAPLPTGWIVMLVASDELAPGVSPVIRIGLVAILGGLATAIANLNEYHILSHRAGARLREKVRDTRAFRWAVRWFDRAPFGALTAIAFVPIPVDVIRWLAILRQYSRIRFALAYIVGRSARYVFLAVIAVSFHLNWWQILLVQLGIIALSALGRLVWVTATRRPEPAPAD